MTTFTARFRRRPGTGPRICGALLAALAIVLVSTSQASAAPPNRQDSADRPILFVHGFNFTQNTNCSDVWGKAETAIKQQWTGPLYTFGYYGLGGGCTFQHYGTANTPIESIGQWLAWDIYNTFTSKGKSIDVIAHSMGGLVIRSALADVARHKEGFPPALYVEDVATLSTPHQGTYIAGACTNSDGGDPWTQCLELEPNSQFLQQLPRNPQAATGTDWTLIGSVADTTVDYTSAIDEGHDNWGHKVYYPNVDNFSHTDMHDVVSGQYEMVYRNKPSDGWVAVSNGAAPPLVAKNAVYWWKNW